MSVLNKVRPKRTFKRCNFCGGSVWNKRRAKKHGCCTDTCLQSWQVLTGVKDHPLKQEFLLRVNRYGKTMYTTIRWLNLRAIVLKRDGFVCLRCGSADRLHVDHITPVSWCKGGYWSQHNLQTLCESCNLTKGAGDNVSWRRTSRIINEEAPF